jgi:hypothetical protein
LGIHGGDDRTSFLWFQISRHTERLSLAGDGQDATLLVGARDVVSKHVLHETPDGDETTIASRRGITTPGFDVIQENEDDLGLDVLQA